ncbi:MAG: hypothetical protein ACK2TV_01595 [Anaerolineales bacterium]
MNIRRYFVKSGYDAALYLKKLEREYHYPLYGEAKVYLIVIDQQCAFRKVNTLDPALVARSAHSKLRYVDRVSHEMVGTRILNEFKPWLKEQQRIPP